MINDFPTSEPGTETSIYADDSAIWRSGRNLKTIEDKLQTDVNKIAKWCDEWGFKLNESKTVAIIFSHSQQALQSKLNIRLNGKTISTETSVKFLGMTFDQRLTWNKHIEKVIDSCKVKMNLLRSLTGQQWGACKRSLLQIYKTLIRPKLEYGMELLHTASRKAWKRMEVVQNTCLRIACGAMHGTAADAIQQECGELPIRLRRQQALLRYTTRISAATNNPATAILQDNWQNHYGNYKPGAEPVYIQTQKFLSQHRIQPSIINSMPTWKSSITVDTTLQQKEQQDSNITTRKQEALKQLEKHKDALHIYTDASVHKTGRTGAAFHIPAYSISAEMKLSDHTAIITAELTAIKAALQFITTANISNKTVVILTDSLSAARAIAESGNSIYRSTETDIMDLAADLAQHHIDVNIMWIPSHTGLQGNETADRLARRAAEKNNIDITIPATRREIVDKIISHIDAEWQTVYNRSTTGHAYKLLEPTVSRKVKFIVTNRHKDTTITRLRLGKCCLNSYLHKIDRHPTGLCHHCNIPETIEHFLLYCPHSNIFTTQPSTSHISSEVSIKSGKKSTRE